MLFFAAALSKYLVPCHNQMQWDAANAIGQPPWAARNRQDMTWVHDSGPVASAFFMVVIPAAHAPSPV